MPSSARLMTLLNMFVSSQGRILSLVMKQVLWPQEVDYTIMRQVIYFMKLFHDFIWQAGDLTRQTNGLFSSGRLIASWGNTWVYILEISSPLEGGGEIFLRKFLREDFWNILVQNGMKFPSDSSVAKWVVLIWLWSYIPPFAQNW